MVNRESEDIQREPIWINGKKYEVTTGWCFYCLRSGVPQTHEGHFLSIPSKFEKATNKIISRDVLEKTLKCLNARVAAVHICLDGNGEFNRTDSVFRENTFL